MILNVRENDVNNSLLFLRLNITKLTLQPVPRDFRVFHSLIPRPSLAPVFDHLLVFSSFSKPCCAALSSRKA